MATTGNIKIGKWLLDCRQEDLQDLRNKVDDRWEELTNIGVIEKKFMDPKINTERNKTKFIAMAVFHCKGNSDQLLETGKRIVKTLDYKGVTKKKIFFKTEQQTEVGTAATGVPAGQNHELHLDIGETIWRDLRSSEVNRRFDAGEMVPMEEMYNKQMYNVYYVNNERFGSMKLFYKPEHIDAAWLKAKDLFEDKRFPEECVQLIVQTTADYSSVTSKKNQDWIITLR